MKQIGYLTVLCVLFFISTISAKDKNNAQQWTKTETPEKVAFSEIKMNVVCIEMRMLQTLREISRSQKLLNPLDEKKRVAFMQTLGIEMNITQVLYQSNHQPTHACPVYAPDNGKKHFFTWESMLREILERSIDAYTNIIDILKNSRCVDTPDDAQREQWLTYYQWQYERRKVALPRYTPVIAKKKLSRTEKNQYRDLLTRAETCIRIGQKKSMHAEMKKATEVLKQATDVYQEALRYYQKHYQNGGLVKALGSIARSSQDLKKLITTFREIFNKFDDFDKQFDLEFQRLQK